MFRRLALVFLAVVATTAAADRAPVRYTLSFPEATTHYLDVEAVIPTDGRGPLILFMPVWTPGSYLVREYARNLITLTAQSPAGDALAVEKIAKNRWQIAATGQTEVRVHYRLFARDVNVRGNWIERDFALVNGAPTFITVADDYQRPYAVRLVLPAGWNDVQTPLAPGAEARTYTAADYDHLVDSPIVAGNPQVDSFEVDGVSHVLVTLGGDGVWDNARVVRNLKVLVEAQRTFWGGLPYRTPYYFFNLLGIGRGGLEHGHSTVLGADRWNSRNRSGIISWLSLASHEFFHVWNGKRLRPVGHGPFDYEREVYTRSLWIVEGITSYYQHVLLRRAGFYSREDYLNTVGGLIANVKKSPARLVQSLGDSSYDAWIKAYRPDENSQNVLFSYYGGGSLAALLLDTEIRRVSQGTRTLDDVMLAAHARYSGERGYTEAQFINLVGEIAGHDLTGFIRGLVDRPGDWDYTPLLEWYGLEFEPPAVTTKVSPNGLEPTDPPPGWLGADTRNQGGLLQVTVVRTGSPAAAAGLAVNDEIIAIDDYRVSPEQLANRLNAYPPGSAVTLLVARRDQLLRLPVTLAPEPLVTSKLRIRADATDEQRARLRAWAGDDAKPAPPAPAPAQTPADPAQTHLDPTENREEPGPPAGT